MHWDINISAGTRDNVFLPFRRESGSREEAENQGSEQAVGTLSGSTETNHTGQLSIRNAGVRQTAEAPS